ncbi:hypothetical protein [Salinirubrum litoreum]|uniref:DUF7988 domain-containing protein n=1 Tax=Salinirubrum litoreum TaxID=1126234 RepID=A0ABD5R7E7_9EURY
MSDTELVRDYLHRDHADLLATVEQCADAVAAGWGGETTSDRSAVVPPLEAALRRSGVTDRLPAVLAGAVSAIGGQLQARPVAGPPYVVVTSVGPVLRATLADRRLVVTFGVFTVRREGDGPRYARRSAPDADLVDVAFR